MNESSTKSTKTANPTRSTAETRALLERLRDAIRDLVARSTEQERDFATRTTKLRAQFDQAISSERGNWSLESERNQTSADEKRHAASAIFEARKLRISRALENARKKRLADIDATESKLTLEVQHGLLEADQQRELQAAATKQAHEKLIADLHEEHANLHNTENRARKTFGAYGSLAKLITTPSTSSNVNLSANENQLLAQFREKLGAVKQELGRTNALILPALFRFLPIWFCLLLALGLPFALVPALRKFDFQSVPPTMWAIVGVSLIGIIVLYLLGKSLASSHAKAAGVALDEARKLYDACAAKAESSYKSTTESNQTAHFTHTKSLNTTWKQAQADARNKRSTLTDELNEKFRRVTGANEEQHRRRVTSTDRLFTERAKELDDATSGRRTELETSFNDNVSKLDAAREAAQKTIQDEWRDVVLPLYTELQIASDEAKRLFPPWRPEFWEKANFPDHLIQAAPFGKFEVDLQKLTGVSLPESDPTVAAIKNELTLPLLLSVPQQASVLFETKTSGHEQVIGALNNLVLRLLTSSPPGKLAFTIFDPVGLGQNFAGIMHLADFEERLINSRIWTQQAQFEQRLADLNEHIEKVTQMYLRNEYATLAEYNEQAGRLAEKYQFLVIADFPVNFSDIAVKRLQSIAASGPRCGVHLLIHWDQRKPAPVEFVPEELRKNAICVVPKVDGFVLSNTNWEGTKLSLDAPPDAELATKLLMQIGKASTDSYRVEMPFSEVAPADNELWSLDTTRELRVPIGRTGATKLQYLALGQGTRQHGLVAGKTGSGKSTLFHVIITNLALWSSPEQVEFYLVDFKKGVEFKTYATHKLPHAKVIAIESDREFGLSVLQRIDDELKRRGDLFRKLGAQDVAGYKRAGGNEPMPRVLLLIDEFQELFVEDDRVSQGAALLLDRIVRQGRAFGIHVLLGSQTLGGAYSLARATIGQMVVRIALQCNEADAYLIMNEDNPAPRLLSRPGEAIYNDEGGAIQGNSPFQIVWLPDQIRDEWLDKAEKVAAEKKVTVEPIIFEGNAPASVRDNPVLRSLLDTPTLKPTKSPRIFLGAPNSIKGPSEAVFQRQSGNHLLIVGQREEAALAMLVTAQIALAAQHAKGSARIFVFDCNPQDSNEARMLDRVAGALAGIRIVSAADTPLIISELATELDRRNENPGGDSPTNFLLIHGLQQNKKLRFDEEASFSLDPSTSAGNPGLLFNKLICEGATQGFHVIATCDTYNNVMRTLSRKALSEFEMRVVFQMSANDSASLIESPAANNLGLHRAILYNGQQGWTETFRPYALPDDAWVAEAGQKITRLQG